MYWSCCQSTGAEMRKYLTEMVSDVHSEPMHHTYLMRDCTGNKDEAHTVVDLLERDDAVRWKALLSVLI
jgi:hypothetical protein